jgi:hypothetical protein
MQHELHRTSSWRFRQTSKRNSSGLGCVTPCFKVNCAASITHRTLTRSNCGVSPYHHWKPCIFTHKAAKCGRCWACSNSLSHHDAGGIELRAEVRVGLFVPCLSSKKILIQMTGNSAHEEASEWLHCFSVLCCCADNNVTQSST